MKKLLSLLLSLSFILSSIVVPEGIGNLFPVRTTAAAQTSTDSWTYDSYTYNGVAGLVLTGYSGDATDVYVPGKLSVDGVDLPVFKLGDGIFANNTGLNSVTLATGIKVIGDGAFAGTTNLVCIVTNEDLAEIGANAFDGCSAFNSIILYDSITAIGENAFAGCGSLTVYCNENTTGYNYAVNNDIPYVILNPDATPETYVVDGITYYIMNGEAVAVKCEYGLTNVTIPSIVAEYPVTSVSTAFRENTTLTSISLPIGIRTIADFAFGSCSNLSHVSLPNSVTSIGNYAFSSCISLESIQIPDGVTSIHSYAFISCKKLKSIEIPPSVTSIRSAAFDNCTALKEVYITDMDAWCNIWCNSYSLFLYGYSNPLSNSAKLYLNGELVTNVTIPDNITYIGPIFEGCSSITSITIPDGATSIRYSAFQGCTNLKNINIPQGITSLEDYTFYGCTSLESIIIPYGCSSIGSRVFYECTNLKSVSIPDTVTSIGSAVFVRCSNLKNITIPDGVSSLEDALFRQCTSLQSITIPSSVSNIGAEVFYGCTVLTNLVLPDNITVIGNSAFYGCTNLENINIPNSVTDIGTYAFYNCSKLANITIPSGITSIGEYTFYNCANIENVIIPEIVTSIGTSAFFGCSKYKSITIPKSVVEIGATAFSVSDDTIMYVYEGSHGHLYALSNNIPYILLSEDSTDEIHLIDGIVYKIEDNEANIVSCGANVTNAVIQASVNGYPVRKIENVFENCTNLTSVVIPEGITTIGNYAFAGCTGLKTINIPEGVTSIGEYAFSRCNNLQSIHFPSTLQTIGPYAFIYSYGFREVHIKDIAAWCNVSLDGIEFSNPLSSSGATLYFNGSPITDLVIPEGVTSIKQGVFYYCNSLTSITIPSSLTYMGNYAFARCPNLSEIIISNGATHIGVNAFYNSPQLTDITIPGSVTVIEDCAFQNCTNLKNVTIAEGTKTIGARAFAGCSSLMNIELPESVTTIELSAFENCSNLSNVKLPNSITSIAIGTFIGCVNISRILIPDNVTYIDSSAFLNCPQLMTLLIPSTVTKIENSAFSDNTILLVYENSTAHTYAVNSNHLYFILPETANPEIAYGAGISGTAKYTDGTAAVGATVDIIYDDGVVKESVTTGETGTYNFTYAEVGRYTIRVTDANGNTDSEQVSIKRMNAFDVFLAGETDLTLRKGYTVSGTINEAATVTLTDPDGNVIASADANGTYSFADIPNGSYVLRAESENGNCVKEIYVYNANVTENIVIEAQSASIEGYVEVEDRDFKCHSRGWVQVTLYNSAGVVVDSCKTDADGKYTFTKLPIDEYSIVAETSEMRPDHKKNFHRSFTLKGYAYVNVETADLYEVDTIVLSEENDHLATISGKVTAQGENQACEVILTNVFRHEVASCTTGKNGKYTFKNIPDGLYFITAVTKSNGMGFTVVMVRHGNVYGETDIFVNKSDKIREHETNMNDIPHCSSRDDAENHRDKIINEKRYYDSLPDRKKKEFSQDYIDRLNHLIELLSECSYQTNSGTIHNSGMMVSGDELRDDRSITLKLTVADHTPHEIGDDGISTDEEFIQQSIEDAATGKNIAKYYDISLKKNVDGLDYEISNVSKHTDTTGKLRITLPIPEDYRGHKHYSFIHVHNGVPTTLIDLDDDPDTVTFEIDKFSTFALTYSDVEVAEEDESLLTASIADQKSFKEANITGVKINVSTSPNFVVSGLSVGYGTEARELSETSISGGSTVLIGMFVPGLVTLTDNDFTVTSINETEE